MASGYHVSVDIDISSVIMESSIEQHCSRIRGKGTNNSNFLSLNRMLIDLGNYQRVMDSITTERFS